MTFCWCAVRSKARGRTAAIDFLLSIQFSSFAFRVVDSIKVMTMANRRLLAIVGIIGAIGAVGAAGGARAQQSIGSTAVVQNQVSRELAGASAPLAVGDSVYRNEVVKTGVDSTAKLVFLGFDQPRRRANLAYRARPVRLRRRSERREGRGWPGEGRFSLHDGQSRQEGLYDHDARRPLSASAARCSTFPCAARTRG